MTTKNTKIMLTIAVMAVLFIPITALAANDNPSIGKTVIKTEIQGKVPDQTLEKLQQLDEMRNNVASDEDRNQIQNQMDALIQEAQTKQPVIDAKRVAEYDLKVEQLTNAIANEEKISQSTIIPYTTLGFDPYQNALAIGIQQDYATADKLEKYAQKIRSIVGNDVDIVVYNGGDYWQLGTCTTRTSNCDPVEAGIQIQFQNTALCTEGFKATYNGKNGFVTAGHCANGQTGTNVGQAITSRTIGTVEKETYDLGSQTEDCDCAFIASTVTVASEVFGISSTYYPHSTGTAVSSDYVKLSGKNSGITTGTVSLTNQNITVTDGTKLTGVTIASYSSTYGDSGGPVMDAFSASPRFLGTNVAFQSGNSAYVTYLKVQSNFSGISWGL